MMISHRLGWLLEHDETAERVFTIDENHCPAFRIGDGVTMHQTSLATALVEQHWFSVVASYDAAHRQVRLTAQPVAKTPCELLTWPAAVSVAEPTPATLAPVQQGPLRFAAAADGPGNGARLKPAYCFNGRLDRVRLCTGVLEADQAHALAGTQIPDRLRQQVVGFWDFGQGIDSVTIHDGCGNGLDGLTVNVPTRGVAGVDWDGSVTDWRQRPEHYSAIHFHDDDLYDAEWTTDFSYRVPDTLPSGMYAARLRHGASEDCIPFFVAPAKGTATAPVAVLLPTTTYTAYANIRFDSILKQRVQTASGDWTVVERDPYPIVLRKAEDAAFLAQQLRERGLGKGVYLHHTDGSHCTIASQKYPNLAIKPKTQNWTLVADTYLTDWLEQVGIAYDVITDDLLQAEGVAVLQPYRVVLSGNHPEYWSAQMLDALSQYQQQGGRWMYLGGNGFFWVTSYHPQLPGAVEVRKDVVYAGIHPPYETRHAFDGQAGGLWSHNGRPAHLLVGVGWEWAPTSGLLDFADLVFFEGPAGGAVFSVGSMAWVGALSHNHYQNDVARITENVLRRFLDPAPFPLPTGDDAAADRNVSPSK